MITIIAGSRSLALFSTTESWAWYEYVIGAVIWLIGAVMVLVFVAAVSQRR